MSSAIERQFRARCQENTSLGPLLAQWEIDSRLYAQALASIGSTFPHYSLHDVSHSERILSRIGSLLGHEGIDRLGGTDMFLLLESAYLHDAGMIVTGKDWEAAIESAGFADYLSDLEQQGGDLGRIATEARRASAVGPTAIYRGYQDLRLLLAEYIRRSHHIRSGHAAEFPFEAIGVSSPRIVELIPARIWKAVGAICEAHGRPRDHVMKIQRRESGVASDYCHPRLIAFLLRLGDLLDLDSGRFCPTLIATLTNLPKASVDHMGKHAGIRSLLVSTVSIDVKGVYTDLDSYMVADSWFAWLREELHHCLLNRHAIAPSSALTSFPTVGKIEARLEGQVLLRPGDRPRFAVDRGRLLDIVRGMNLYSGPWDAIREVLQNAIDATLLRYAHQLGSSVSDPPATDPAKLRDALEDYPVEVRIHVEEAGFDDESIPLTVLVRDRGIGMRIDDIRLLLRLGSSGGSSYKRRLVAALPEWARPSGTFGIGIHSLFQYASSVVIRTRHPDAGDAYEITFGTDLASHNEPSVVIRKVSGRHGTPLPHPGTEVAVSMTLLKIPRSISLDLGRYAYEATAGYDYVYGKPMLYAVARMRDMVASMGRGSLVPIMEDGCDGFLGAGSSTAVRFSQSAGAEVELVGFSLGGGGVSLSYRGAPVGSRLSLPLLTMHCNIHAGDARDLLELSRDRLSSSGQRAARRCVNRAIDELLPQWLFVDDVQLRCAVSLFAYIKGMPDAGDEWRNLVVGKGGRSLADMMKSEVWHISRPEARNAIGGESRGYGVLAIEDGESDPLRIVALGNFGNFDDWLAPLVMLDYKNVTVTAGTEGFEYTCMKSATATEDVTEAGMVHAIKRGTHRILGRRGWLPCPKEFVELAVDQENMAWVDATVPLIQRFMPNPLVGGGRCGTLRMDGLRRYCAWIVEQNGGDLNKVAIKTLEFLGKYIPLLREDGVPVDGDVEAARAELGVRA